MRKLCHPLNHGAAGGVAANLEKTQKKSTQSAAGKKGKKKKQVKRKTIGWEYKQESPLEKKRKKNQQKEVTGTEIKNEDTSACNSGGITNTSQN